MTGGSQVDPHPAPEGMTPEALRLIAAQVEAWNNERYGGCSDPHGDVRSLRAWADELEARSAVVRPTDPLQGMVFSEHRESPGVTCSVCNEPITGTDGVFIHERHLAAVVRPPDAVRAVCEVLAENDFEPEWVEGTAEEIVRVLGVSVLGAGIPPQEDTK